MLEWLKRHAWKACNRQNRFAGSNPVLSASFISVQLSPCRRRAVFFVFCILVAPHLRRGLWIMPSSQLAVPIGGFVFLFPCFLTKTPRFHLFTFSPFHLFTISALTKTPRFHLFTFSPFDENTTISPFHFFTFSPFSPFSPHQSPETMLSPLISPLHQAEIHELVIVQRRGDTRR